MKKYAKGRTALKIILLVLIVFIIFIVQNTNGMPNHIGRGRFFFLVPLVICIGITQGVTVGTWLGLFAGMLWDCVSAELPGFHSIALLCFGCVSALMIDRLFRSNIVTAIAMCSVGSAFYCFIYWFFFLWLPDVSGAANAFVTVYLPSIFLTAVTGPIFYLVVAFVSKKLKRLG